MTYRYPGGVIRKNAANTAITGASGVWDLGSQAQAVKTNTWPISGLANPVSGSLRFRGGSVNAFLSRTPASSSNRRTWTWSGWIKLGSKFSDGYFPIFGADATGYPCSGIALTNFNIQYFSYTHPAYDWQKISTAVFRDPSAWYHIVAVSDTTNGTAEDRAIVYVNGQRITSWSTNNNPSPSFEGYVNSSSYITKVGRIAGFDYFDGCMAEVNFVDGLVLTPSSFGQTSPITGVWEPIKYTGTYGTNGFYLSLSDTSSIGKDFSGNGNNLTPNNISTANDSTFDLMRDVPTQYTPQGVTDVGGVVRGNYCTLNPLAFFATGASALDGNLTLSVTTAGGNIKPTFGATTGKFYAEFTINNIGGATGTQFVVATSSPSTSATSLMNAIYYVNGQTYDYVSASYVSYGASYTTGDIIGVAWDCDAFSVTFYKNNVSQGTLSGAAINANSAGQGVAPIAGSSGSPSSISVACNYGQRPFAYTPPSGFKSLCTTNLPTPTIGATTATAANKYFDATLITGTAATQVITNAGGFQPDFVWLKSRTNANNPTIYDAIRGVNTILYPALTNAEAVGSAQLTAFNSNGFTLGASENANDSNGEASVGWQWNAGGSTVTNTAGSISSQVRANPTAGFSVVTYTGNNTASTVGHGLGVAPSMYIVKLRSTTGAWGVYHSSLAASQVLYLNTTDSVDGSVIWNSTAPTSSVFSVGAHPTSNPSGQTLVAYCFAPVAGYSAFGSYTGNGSTDGPFIYTGFRPKWIMIKLSSGSGSGWLIYDSSRNTYNLTDLYLQANQSNAEAGNSTDNPFDFLSNGFKARYSNSATNQSGGTFIYMAFAENPFKNSLAR